ncbi:Ubiquinone biosynthesis protein coq9, mitochondrial [Coemansia sp. RSA 1937]|nr:Ubiquinone biosynthesis protein coq9, mitochondrial [Coemansia sp. RSA 1937]
MNSAMRRCGHQALGIRRALYTTNQTITKTFQPTDEQKVRGLILNHALTKFNQLGWTPAAIEQAATDLNYPPTTVLAYNGMPLIKHFMFDALNKTSIDQLHEFKTPIDRIRCLCRVRLRQTQPYIRHWHDAFLQMMEPKYELAAASWFFTLATRMWEMSGDQSLQIDWDRKRAVLADVYVATELYMCEDTSADFGDTWKYLDEAIEHMEDNARGMNRAPDLRLCDVGNEPASGGHSSE